MRKTASENQAGTGRPWLDFECLDPVLLDGTDLRQQSVNRQADPRPTVRRHDRNSPRVETGFALVELYTSQGCSSCPPADRVLQQIVGKAAEEQLPVYCLSIHVDYWNRLGPEQGFISSAGG